MADLRVSSVSSCLQGPIKYCSQAPPQKKKKSKQASRSNDPSDITGRGVAEDFCFCFLFVLFVCFVFLFVCLFFFFFLLFLSFFFFFFFSFSFSFFLLFTFWNQNHWNLFWVYQNGKISTGKKSISRREKRPLKLTGPFSLNPALVSIIQSIMKYAQ